MREVIAPDITIPRLMIGLVMLLVRLVRSLFGWPPVEVELVE